MNVKKDFQPWFVCLSAALFFCYTIIQLTVFGAISADLMRSFKIQSGTLSTLSALYLYMASLFYLPAGILFDRFSTRTLLVITCVTCSIGTALIALSPPFLFFALIGRILVGASNPFSFLGPIRLVSRWFPPKRVAMMMGLVVAIGMSGGIISQSPFTLLMKMFDWRIAMLINAFLGILIAVLMFILIKEKETPAVHAQSHKKSFTFFQSFKIFSGQSNNWYCGFYTGIMNLPLVILGALWGNLYLIQGKGLSPVTSANIISFIFIGLIVGAPLIGAISDRIGKRKILMIISAVFVFLVILGIIYLSVSTKLLALLFFLLGLFSGSQVMSYPIVIASNPREIESTAMSLASILVNLFGAISQMVVAGLIAWKWDGTMLKGVPFYSLENFKLGIWLLPIAFLISLILALLVRENLKIK